MHEARQTARSGKFLPLLKVQVLGLLGINRLIHSRKKGRVFLFFLGIVLLASILAAYGAGIALLSFSLEMGEETPSLMLLFCVSLTLLVTLIQGSRVLVNCRDYDLLMSLPVRTQAAVWSRVFAVYALDLLVLTALVLPGLLVYGVLGGIPGGRWPMLFLSPLLGALLPLAAAAIFGAALSLVTARFRRRNLLSILASLAAVLLASGVSFSLRFTENGEIAAFGRGLSAWFLRVYPPARLYSRAILQGRWDCFALFALVSAASLWFAVFLLSRFFMPLHASLAPGPARRGLPGRLRTAGPFRALYIREFRRFLASPLYVLNTCAGAAILIMAGIGLLSKSARTMELIPGIMEPLSRYAACIPLVPALFLVTGSTTAASLSLEGKSRWLLASLPVPVKLIYDAKIALNLTILLPAAWIGALLFAAALRVSGAVFCFLLAVPTVYCCFIAVLGLRMNARFPRYDWVNEAQPLKQSASAFFTVAIGFLSLIFPLVLIGFFPSRGKLILLGLVFLLISLTAWLYRGLAG
jgi:ABC-2 type transport system permease protein